MKNRIKNKGGDGKYALANRLKDVQVTYDNCISKFNKNPNLRKKYDALCRIITSPGDDNISKIDLDDALKVLHLLFNNTGIIDLYNKELQNLTGLCFLHNVDYYNNFSYIEDGFYIKRHTSNLIGYTREKLDVDKFYTNEILNCNDSFLLLPFSTHWVINNEAYHHQNMIFIEREQHRFTGKIITMEYFEPNGYLSEADEFKNKGLELVKALFVGRPGEVESDDDIYLIPPLSICPLQNKNYLQTKLQGSNFSGSCSIISFWYGLNRMLFPDESYKKARERMDLFLDKNPAAQIELVVSAFIALIGDKPYFLNLVKIRNFLEFVNKMKDKIYDQIYDAGTNAKNYVSSWTDYLKSAVPSISLIGRGKRRLYERSKRILKRGKKNKTKKKQSKHFS
jgi:hypothetical protein